MGDVWTLSRERDWYTTHVLQFAKTELDDQILIRQVSADQAFLDDFVDDSRGREGNEATENDSN